MHQELMDSAYEKFSDNLNTAEWMTLLTEQEKKAVVVGNLNYQVENGGFVQWVDNGYYLDSEILKKVLTDMDTENSKKILKMVEEVLAETNPNAKRIGFFGSYWLSDVENDDVYDEDEDSSFDNMPSHSSFNNLDEEYYTLNEKFMEEFELFISKEVTHG